MCLQSSKGLSSMDTAAGCKCVCVCVCVTSHIPSVPRSLRTIKIQFLQVSLSAMTLLPLHQEGFPGADGKLIYACLSPFHLVSTLSIQLTLKLSLRLISESTPNFVSTMFCMCTQGQIFADIGSITLFCISLSHDRKRTSGTLIKKLLVV